MSFNPNWISAPGDTISDILHERKITTDFFAEKINKDKTFTQELLNGNRIIDNELAHILQDTLGFTKDFWINRDKIYTERNQLLLTDWASKLPTVEMRKLGLFNGLDGKISGCLNFFGVNNFKEWSKKYNNLFSNLAFRKSPTFETDIYSVAVWIRQAETLTENYKLLKWDKNLFELKLISEIKPLSRIKNPKIFIPILVKLCAECGVKLAIVKSLGKNRASGATFFLDGKTPYIVLSCRHLTDDYFWFTFFHEAGHLIMHSENKLRLEFDNFENIDSINEEQEANIFAEECLIPHSIQKEIYSIKSNTKKLINFSIKANISPGIVVGQMQYKKVIPFNYLNTFKRKYNWEDISEGIKNIRFD